MQVTDEMKEWLNERSHRLDQEGGLIFANFLNEFDLDKDSAKELIRTWDAERRGIPMDKTKKD